MGERDGLTLSVPGKLFLGGEWAVLRGAPAVVTAVSRRARLFCRPGEPGIVTIDSRGRHRQIDLPDRLADRIDRQTGLSHRIAIDLGPLWRNGRSLGLGGSAATSALLTAYAFLVGRRGPEQHSQGPGEVVGRLRRQIWGEARKVHSEWQGGRGSGADVATAVFGNTLLYELGAPFDSESWARVDREYASSSARRIGCLEIDEAHRILAVWTGTSSHSRQLLETVSTAATRHPAYVEPVFDRLADSASRFVPPLVDGDSNELAAAVEGIDRSLGQLDNCTGAGIHTPTHRRIRRVASEHSATAKISGAGGGDFSLVFGSTQTDWSGIRDRLSDLGLCFFIDDKSAGLRLEKPHGEPSIAAHFE